MSSCSLELACTSDDPPYHVDMETFLINFAINESRRETLYGKEHVVVPMHLIVPGVLNGSEGPLLYAAEEVFKHPEIWNHMPIVRNHPVDANKKPIPARTSEILNKSGMGVVLNAHEANGKLAAEGWFDLEATKKIDLQIYNKLLARQPMEVSTGLFADTEKAPEGSNFNGVVYNHVTKYFRPDHLAVLTDGKGACSLKDGCGVFNQADEKAIESWWQSLKRFMLISGMTEKPVVNQDPVVPVTKEGNATMKPEEREVLVNKLAANCKCQESGKKVLNGLTDDDLTALAAKLEKEPITNAAPPLVVTPVVPLVVPQKSDLTADQIYVIQNQITRDRELLLAQICANHAPERVVQIREQLTSETLEGLKKIAALLPPAPVHNQYGFHNPQVRTPLPPNFQGVAPPGMIDNRITANQDEDDMLGLQTLTLEDFPSTVAKK